MHFTIPYRLFKPTNVSSPAVKLLFEACETWCCVLLRFAWLLWRTLTMAFPHLSKTPPQAFSSPTTKSTVGLSHPLDSLIIFFETFAAIWKTSFFASLDLVDGCWRRGIQLLAVCVGVNKEFAFCSHSTSPPSRYVT
jgi:hypothetical protein